MKPSSTRTIVAGPMERELRRSSWSPFWNAWCCYAVVVTLVIGSAPSTQAADLVIDDWVVVARVSFPTSFSSAHPRNQHDYGVAQIGYATNGAIASAYQTPGGWNKAEVRAAGPLEFNVHAETEAYMSIRVRNQGLVAVPLNFRFLIFNSELQARLSNYVAVVDDEPDATIHSAVQYAYDWPYEPRTNVWRYKASVTLRNAEIVPGVQDNLEFVDPQKIGKPVAHVTAGRGWINVQFETFVGVLDLGMLEPGKIAELTYRIFASIDAGVNDTNIFQFGPPEMMGHALIEDPFGLGSSFSINGQNLNSLLPGQPRITFTRLDANSLALSWPTNFVGWRLQVQTNLSATNTNWFPVLGSETTNRVALPMAGSTFFVRLANE